MAIATADRNAQILRLRGKLSYTLIAERLGTTRNVVAGVCWREDWRGKRRKGASVCGMGRHGSGRHATITVANS